MLYTEYVTICDAILAAWSSIYPTHNLGSIEIIAAIVQYYKSSKTEVHTNTLTELHTALCHSIQASLHDNPSYAQEVYSDDKSNVGSIKLSHNIYLTQLLLYLYMPTVSASVTATDNDYGMDKATESLNIDLLWRLLQSRYVRYISYTSIVCICVWYLYSYICIYSDNLSAATASTTLAEILVGRAAEVRFIHIHCRLTTVQYSYYYSCVYHSALDPLYMLIPAHIYPPSLLSLTTSLHPYPNSHLCLLRMTLPSLYCLYAGHCPISMRRLTSMCWPGIAWAIAYFAYLRHMRVAVSVSFRATPQLL